MSFQFNIVSLFPELIDSALSCGVVGQAIKAKKLAVEVVNPRKFTEDVHKTVDDRPFGGGDGMLMLADPLLKSLQSLGTNKGRVVYLSPHGKTWNDRLAREWASAAQPITLLCGRYAGIDQRVINNHIDEEVSLGDFVLSGGELAALAVVDSVARFVPGVLGNADSPHQESFSKGLLEHPQFTRPRELEGQIVPEVLLSGHHRNIKEWKRQMALIYTALRRPDLFVIEIEKGSVSLDELLQAIAQVGALPEAQLLSCGLEQEVLAQLKEKYAKGKL